MVLRHGGTGGSPSMDEPKMGFSNSIRRAVGFHTEPRKGSVSPGSQLVVAIPPSTGITAPVT